MRNNKACGLLMAAIAAAMLMAGCQKDTVTIRARITPFGNDKVTMNGLTPQWQIGDSIRVNTFDQSVAVSNSGNTTSITVLSSATYKAVYPGEYVTAVAGYQFGLSLPQTQTYITDGNGNQVVKAPLGAYSKDLNLNFTPLGALLAINIVNDFTNNDNEEPTIIVDTVKVTALNGSSLWGNATVENITLENHKYVMAEGTGSNSITLNGTNQYEGLGISLAHGSTFTCYVFIPEVSGERFAINVYAHDASGFRYAFSYEQAEGMSYSLGRADLASVGYSTADAARTERFVPLGAVDGLFSINSNGDKVYFSKGNLQWSYKNGGSTATSHDVNGSSTPAGGTWRFALHQYDVIGQNSGNTTALANERATQSDWIDLFQRGCSGISIGSNNYYPYTLFSPACTTDMANTNHDWGVYNAISNGGDTPGQWRTLTLGEWDYVITGRPSSLAKQATVNSVSGYILLPDNWAWSGNVASYSSKSTFTADEWRYMEKSGAVFLPNTPNPQTKQDGNGDKIDKWNSGINNCYWTTTTTPDNKADNTTHSAISLKVDKNVVSYTNNGFKTNELKFLCAVRLVQDDVAPTTNTTDE